MALVRWEPVRELYSLQNEMNRLFNTFFDTPTAGNGGSPRRWIPAMDLVETDDHFVLKADLPGLAEGDVHIDVEDDVLTVSGERKAEHEDKREGYVPRRALVRLLPPLADAPRGRRRRRRHRELRPAASSRSASPSPRQRKPRRVAIQVGDAPAPRRGRPRPPSPPRRARPPNLRARARARARGRSSAPRPPPRPRSAASISASTSASARRRRVRSTNHSTTPRQHDDHARPRARRGG